MIFIKGNLISREKDKVSIFIRKTILSKVGCIFRLFLFIRSIKGGCKKYFVKNSLCKKNGVNPVLNKLVLV